MSQSCRQWRRLRRRHDLFETRFILVMLICVRLIDWSVLSHTRTNTNISTHPPTHSLTHTLTHSLTHPPAHSLTHPLTHSPPRLARSVRCHVQSGPGRICVPKRTPRTARVYLAGEVHTAPVLEHRAQRPSPRSYLNHAMHVTDAEVTLGPNLIGSVVSSFEQTRCDWLYVVA